MQLKFLALASVALSASHVQAAMQAKAVVKSITDMTEVSGKTNAMLKDLKGPTETTQAVPKAVENIKDIIMSILKDISMLSEALNTDFKPADQSDICTAFHGFTTVQGELLNSVIGTKGVLSSTPFPTLVSAVLHILGAAVDNLANGVISLVPTCADEAKSDMMTLNGILSTAVNTFPVDHVGSVADTTVGGAKRPTGMRDTANKMPAADGIMAKEKMPETMMSAQGMKKVVNKMPQADGTMTNEKTPEDMTPAQGMKKVFKRMTQADGTMIKEKMTKGMMPAQEMEQTANKMPTKNM